MRYNKIECHTRFGSTLHIIAEDGKSMLKICHYADPLYHYGIYIEDLIVHPSVRRQGRATQLMKYAEALVWDRYKRSIIHLMVETWDLELQHWYEKMGYTKAIGGLTATGAITMAKVLKPWDRDKNWLKNRFKIGIDINTNGQSDITSLQVYRPGTESPHQRMEYETPELCAGQHDPSHGQEYSKIEQEL